MVEGPHDGPTPSGWRGRQQRGERASGPGSTHAGHPPPESGHIPPPPYPPPRQPLTPRGHRPQGGPAAGPSSHPPRSHRREAPGDRRGTAGSPGATPPRGPPTGGGRPRGHRPRIPPAGLGEALPRLRVPRHPGRGATGPVGRAAPSTPPARPTVLGTGQRSCTSAQGRPAAPSRRPHAGAGGCSMGATPSKDRATLMRPALVPARGRQRGRPRQSNSKVPAPQGPPTATPQEGGTRTAPSPPPQTDPPAASQAELVARGCQTAPAEHAAGGDARHRVAGLWRGAWAGTFGPAPRSCRGTGPRDRRGAARPHGATPPPLSPSPPPSARGILKASQGGASPLPPPLGQGGSPPPKRAAAPRGGSAVRPIRHTPPCRHPRAPTVTSTDWQSRAGAQGHPASRTRGRRANTNRNSMETTPSMS